MKKIQNIKENKALKDYLATLDKTVEHCKGRKNKATYQDFLKDKYMLATAIKHGVPKNLFIEIAQFANLEDKQWSTLLHINLRTFQKYKSDSKHIFTPYQSQRIFEIAEVFFEGLEVFDNPVDFREWLTSPSIALGNINPIELLDSSYGKELIMAELSRIEHGIFA